MDRLMKQNALYNLSKKQKTKDKRQKTKDKRQAASKR